jgi:hypothetical protein
MSSSPPASDKHHAPAWIGAVAIALTLYVLTWPVVEMKCTKVTRRTNSGSLHGSYFHETQLSMDSPAWVQAFYAPLHALCGSLPGRNPLVAYWVWWRDVLGYEGLFFESGPEWAIPKP